MRIRNAALILLSIVCLGLGPGQPVHPYAVFDDDGFVFEAVSWGSTVGETQSTIVRPGTTPCPGGRLLVTDERQPGANGSVRWIALDDPTFTQHAATFTAPDPSMYLMSTSDHDLVQLGNGEVWYVMGAFTRRALLQPPGKPALPWFAHAYRAWFGPGARSVAMVWRSTDCGETFQEVPSLEFDPARFDATCALPQRPRIFRHKPATNVPEMLLPTAPATAEWHFCTRCGELVAAKGICPSGGEHEFWGDFQPVSASSGAAGVVGWQRCKNCGALYQGTNTQCAARAHDDATSPEYQLINALAPDPNLEPDWHWCAKCGALFHGAEAGTKCPYGGQHDDAGSQYQAARSSFAGKGETGWRMCSKCRGLYLPTAANGTGGVCPFGSAHTPAPGVYKQLTEKPAGFGTQGEWKMCSNCRMLHFSHTGYPSTCPFVRAHQPEGTSVYTLALGSNESQWRKCEKCGTLYSANKPDTACPFGDEGEQAIYDGGGSDGQLAYSDPANHRVFLTFQCVGFLPDAGATSANFELSGTHVNKTLIAASDGTPWRLAGTAGVARWRMGVASLTKNDVFLGYSDIVQPAQYDGIKLTFGQAKQVEPGLGWDFDWHKPPYDPVRANLLAHTVIARTPGAFANRVLLVAPDTIVERQLNPKLRARRHHGYRLFFYDAATGDSKEALDGRIVAEANVSGDVAFHLQVIDAGAGSPILLTWNEYNPHTQTVQVRGRFITGELQMTGDFTISRATGQPRSFAVSSPYWFGDYQTSAGYLAQSAGKKWIYRPIWVEPGLRLRVGHVEYTPKASSFLITSRAKIRKALPVDLSKLAPSEVEPPGDPKIIRNIPPRQ